MRYALIVAAFAVVSPAAGRAQEFMYSSQSVPITADDLNAAAAQNLTLMQQANAAAGYTTAAQAAAAAPVQSVNALTGAVSVPSMERRAGTLLNASLTTSNGYTYATWSYGYTFQAPPKCFPAINSASDTVTFSQPVVTAKSTTAVTFKFRVLPITLSIALGALTLAAPLPTDTTIDILCVNPI